MERIGVIRQNGEVVNSILWSDETSDQLLADGITDFQEVTNLDPRPGIGWTWSENDGFRPPKTYPSWSWNGVEWEAPISRPEGDVWWNEEAQSWDAIPTEESTP